MLRIVGRDRDALTCPGCSQGLQETVLLYHGAGSGQQPTYIKRCRACAAKAVLGAQASRKRLDAILEALEQAVIWVNSRPEDIAPSEWARLVSEAVQEDGVDARAEGERVIIKHAGALCPGSFMPI